MEKVDEKNFTLHIASAETKDVKPIPVKINGEERFTLTVKYGDFSDSLKKSVTALEQVNPYISWITHYAERFSLNRRRNMPRTRIKKTCLTVT